LVEPAHILIVDDEPFNLDVLDNEDPLHGDGALLGRRTIAAPPARGSASPLVIGRHRV
jgi:hypothetical protein